MRGGAEEVYDYTGDWWGQGGDQLDYCGNLIMLLERGGCDGKTGNGATDDGDTTRRTCIIGEHDPLMNARKCKPIALHNKYQLLHDEDDDDDDINCEDNIDAGSLHQPTYTQTANNKQMKHNPNKRQRQRRKQETLTTTDSVITNNSTTQLHEQLDVATASGLFV